MNPSQNDTDHQLSINYKQSTWEPPQRYTNIEIYLDQVKHKILATFDNSPVLKIKQNPRWLHNALQQLEIIASSDLIIKPADKNMGVVIQNRMVYERDCINQLHDTATYRPINQNTINFNTILSQLEEILHKHNKLNVSYNTTSTSTLTPIAKYILQMKNCTDKIRFARFYLLYKVHKPLAAGQPVPGRPICSNIDTVTYYASKYVDRMLQPYMKLTRSYTQSSQSLVLLLEQFRIDDSYKEDMHILCADITSLYPNIPIDTGVSFMRQRLINLHNDEIKHINHQPIISMNDIDFITELTQFVLNNNYIEFGDRKYQQTCGTAMGTPLAVVFANLFLQQLESEVHKQLRTEFPVLFKRYIDDLLALFKCKQHALQYIKIYNSIVPTIKITHTLSKTSGDFLDTTIFRGPRYVTENKLDVKLYQKPQSKFQYLPESSFHKPSTYPAFVSAELHRIRLNCSLDSDFTHNKQLFYTRLINRDYSPHRLKPLFELPIVRQRILNKLIMRQSNQSNKQSHVNMIFKTIHCQESTQIKLKQCLRLTEFATNDSNSKQIFGNKNPIICSMSSKNIGQLLSRTQYKHTVTCDLKSEKIDDKSTNQTCCTQDKGSENRYSPDVVSPTATAKASVCDALFLPDEPCGETGRN